MTTRHILIPDNLAPIGIDHLRKVPDFRLTVGPLTREETLAAAKDAHAMIIRSATTVDAEMLNAAPDLQAVVRAGVGVDNIDLETAGARGIVVMNAPDGNTLAAVEHTLALMLALARNVPIAQQTMREGRWDRKKFMGVELRGKTLGIIGLGRTGRGLARHAQALGMTTIAHDPYQKSDVFAQAGVREVPLDELYAESDFITLHALITEETRGMINSETIAQMKDGVRIINTARGALIADNDLAAAIRSNKVAGAAVDVYEVEPPPADHPLIGLDGVIHTPHLGASTHEAQLAVATQAARQVCDALQDQKYSNVVNADLLNGSIASTEEQ